MFDSENSELKDHIETSSRLKINSVIIAEWNMNDPENLYKIGNFRYRPTESTSPYKTLESTFSYTESESAAITNATYSDVKIDGGLDDSDVPVTFTSVREKERLLYSLEDCFSRFRPRSGINKLRYFSDRYSHFDNANMSERPRYYMGHKNDTFKYWTSYRIEDGIERGISKSIAGQNIIDDTVPFVVYKNEAPVNRIVLKMQTNIGNIDLGPFYDNAGSYDDPFYGNTNKTVPQKWTLQFLEKTTNAQNQNVFTWRDAYSVNDASVISNDGYLELAYDVVVPTEFASTFKKSGTLSAKELLPTSPAPGSAFLVTSSNTDLGLYYVYTGIGDYRGYNSFIPTYGWFKKDEALSNLMGVATELVDTPSYFDVTTSKTKYREFVKICGLRIVVETMSKDDCSFDLIELSPRLAVDLSDKTTSYSIKKTASDLGSTGLPVGQLLSSTGSLSILDYDNAFNENNSDSILANYTLSKNIQIKFFEAILDVPIYENNVVVQELDYYVPIKTMYADGFPKVDKETRAVSITLRDLFFYFESTIAPQILVQNVSVSYAVSLLLDSIGFSNYTFKRNDGESETIIPFFFVPPDKSVAEILQDIAVSTQTAMFFDEYNNFVLMSKNYIMPTEDERATDLVLRGTVDYEKDDVYKNKITAASNSKLANIIAISSANNNVFNDGVIAYNTRYIQKSYGSIRQASLIDQDQTWIYKPVLLWEVAGTEKTKSQNDNVGNQSSYSLSAIPLNTTLTSDLPTVVSVGGTPQIINNTVNFGEGIYWISRYNGYFFANGEIIKYDAVQYNIPGYGNKWITSAEDYNNYFSKIPFNGKLYPTGLVRIFAEPNYQQQGGTTIMKVGPVAKHGRGQFGTTVTSHQAGLDPYWTNKATTAPVRGIKMDSKFLFGKNADFNISNVFSEVANKQSFSVYYKDTTLISGSVVNGSTLLQSTNHGLAVGNAIYFTTAPTGITANTTLYYVKSIASDNTFTIATSLTGEDIKFTTNQSFVARKNNVTINTTSSVFTSIDHRLNNGEMIAFVSSGTLPTGMNANTIYYVVNKTTDTFKIALTPGGTAISVSAPQTNFHTFIQYFDGKIQPAVNVLSGSISIANPGLIKENAHGLSYNDKIGFDSTGTLPTGITANTEYYVKGVLSDSLFTISDSSTSKSVATNGISRSSQSSVSIAAGGIITATSHGLAVNDEIYFSAGTLPATMSTNTIYYVHSVTGVNTFKICASIGGAAISSTGSQSGITLQKALSFTSNAHGFAIGDAVTLTRATPSEAMPGTLVTTSVYYIKSKDTNSFTLSRTNGGGKLTMTGSLTMAGSSVLQVSKNLVTSGSVSGNIQLIKYAVPNSSTNNFRLPKHGLSAGDKISFSVSAGGTLPTNITAGTVYFVKSADLTANEFKVSTTSSTGSTVSLSGTSTGKISITLYPTIDLSANTINQANTGLSTGDRVFFKTTGSLPTGITTNKIYYVISASNPTFKISETNGGSEIDLSGTDSGNHTITKVNDTTIFRTTTENRLEVNKKITFATTGSLPNNMKTSTSYYTKRILDRQTFTISDSWTNFDSLNPTNYYGSNATFGAVGALTGSSQVSLSISENINDVQNGSTSSELLNSSIVVPDSSRIQIGYYVEIYQGTGETASDSTRVVSIINNQYGTDTIIVSPALKQPIIRNYVDPVNGDQITNIIRIVNRSPAAPSTSLGKAGVSENNNTLARKASRTGVIKNFMTNSTITETDTNNLLATQTGTIQSSAFIFNGPAAGAFPVGDANTESIEPLDFVSYIYKPLTDKFSHFGTRMRIIGRIDGTQDKQSPAGSCVYYSVSDGTQVDQNITISGGSGGIGIMVNPETNNGYYLEIIGLTQNNINKYFSNQQFHNIIFYKTVRRNVDMATISQVSRSNKTVTITTNNEHEFTVNDLVTIKGVDNGTTRTNFNGSFKITAITPLTFQYTITDSGNQSGSGFTGGMAYVQENAIPVKLWGGTTQIVVDDGTFVGQARTMAEENPSVYDLAVEYKDVDTENNGKSRQFYIYLNGKLVASVIDSDPLPIYNNMAMFVRGSARCMFENIYAVANNYSENTSAKLSTPGLSTVFGISEVTVNDSFKKYAMSGLVQSTYLSGISPASPPQYNIYFDEFGTIMREAAHFNIKYDKAYPALYAKLSPTFNSIKGYTVAGFMAGAYGAEFLIFNNTDTVLSLDDTSGNYLRIQGATFTQQSEHNYTVDDHFKHTGDFSNIEIGQGSDISSYNKAKQDYQDIKNSRLAFGKNQFTLNAPYIQDYDSAQGLMSWMISKILKPRKSVGIKVFGLPTAQLGDIVEIDYKANDNNIDQVAQSGSRFVIYDIEYSRSTDGPDIVLYLSEVK